MDPSFITECTVLLILMGSYIYSTRPTYE